MKKEDMDEEPKGKMVMMVHRSKPSLEVNEKDIKGLQGKTVGDKCELLIKGTINEVRKASEYDENKSNKYRIEIDKIENYGSKRM